MTDEPAITIDGVLLSEGQSMTVRVALAAFSLQLGDLGDDLHGRRMSAAYRDRLREIFAIMRERT
jgi:hypothetical protein